MFKDSQVFIEQSNPSDKIAGFEEGLLDSIDIDNIGNLEDLLRLEC